MRPSPTISLPDATPLATTSRPTLADQKNVMEVWEWPITCAIIACPVKCPPVTTLPGDNQWKGRWKANFEIRTAADPDQLIPSVRQDDSVRQPRSAREDVRPLVQNLETYIAQPRMLARLCSLFGFIALLLAATGLYGVLSYGVTRRTNEIGIRMALGAGRRNVVDMILRETGVMIVIGVVAGVIFTAIGVRLVKSNLYGLGALDPWAVMAAWAS